MTSGQSGASVFCDGFGCYFSSYAIHWNGTQWVLTNPPGASLGGVQALASNNVYAVGTFSVGTLITRWNGKSWRKVPSPDPENGGALNEITSTPGKLWSVGSFFDPRDDRGRWFEDTPSATQGTVTGTTGVSGATVSVVWCRHWFHDHRYLRQLTPLPAFRREATPSSPARRAAARRLPPSRSSRERRCGRICDYQLRAVTDDIRRRPPANGARGSIINRRDAGHDCRRDHDPAKQKRQAIAGLPSFC